MRLPDSAHTTRPWRIHRIAPDFQLEDVWSYRTPGAGREDFTVMLDALRAAGGLNENPVLVRALFAVRWKLGAIFGWDKPREGLAGRVTTLRDRLPADLRQDEAGEPVPHTPFTMLYELDDECAIELANKTVHDICHLGWVPTSTGEYKLQMAALVKPNGRLGRLYMTAIKPLRHLIVYPALTRKWERAWLNRESYRPAATDPAAAATAGRAATSDTNHRPPQASVAATGALPWDEAPRRDRRSPAITWAGRLIVFYGAAHTIGAFAVEGAGSHLQAWLRGDLWGGDLMTANGRAAPSPWTTTDYTTADTYS